VHPTETIYGIGGIVQPRIERKLHELKNRPSDYPMLLVAGRTCDFDALELCINRTAQVLMDTFWPGKLTIVLESRTLKRRIGVRVSSHPFFAAISGHLRSAVFSTSANRSGEPYRGDPDFIHGIFSGCADFMIDAGVLPHSPPSTVVDVREDGRVGIVREGVVGAQDIHRITECTPERV
jgi:L-threonylcarbamoyladenylate synthase